MVFKMIIRGLIFLIGIILFNAVSYMALTEFTQFIDLNKILFANRLNGISYSIVLSLIGIAILVLVKLKFSNEIFSNNGSLKSDLIIIGVVNFFWGVLLFFLLGFICLLAIVFMLLFKIPFTQGWEIITENYFNNPDLFFKRASGIRGEYLFIMGIIQLCIFLLIIAIVFLKESKKAMYDKVNYNTWLEEKFAQLYRSQSQKFKLLAFLYLLYFVPSIIVWFYPIALNWYNQITGNSNYIIPVRLSFKILSYIFLAALFFTIYKIRKYNRSTFLSDLKEDIKREIEEENNSGATSS